MSWQRWCFTSDSFLLLFFFFQQMTPVMMHILFRTKVVQGTWSICVGVITHCWLGGSQMQVGGFGHVFKFHAGTLIRHVISYIILLNTSCNWLCKWKWVISKNSRHFYRSSIVDVGQQSSINKWSVVHIIFEWSKKSRLLILLIVGEEGNRWWGSVNIQR